MRVGSMFRDRTALATSAENIVSRSKTRYRDALSYGNASRSCWQTHRAVGRSVMFQWVMSRRPCRITNST